MYIQRHRRIYIHRCMHAYVRGNIKICVHTYSHVYIHASIGTHTSKHAYMRYYVYVCHDFLSPHGCITDVCMTDIYLEGKREVFIGIIALYHILAPHLSCRVVEVAVLYISLETNKILSELKYGLPVCTRLNRH